MVNQNNVFELIAQTHRVLRREKNSKYPDSIAYIQEALVGCHYYDETCEVMKTFNNKFRNL